jgi:DNA-binding FrmR family transcriptional regulator
MAAAGKKLSIASLAAQVDQARREILAEVLKSGVMQAAAHAREEARVSEVLAGIIHSLVGERGGVLF